VILQLPTDSPTIFRTLPVDCDGTKRYHHLCVRAIQSCPWPCTHIAQNTLKQYPPLVWQIDNFYYRVCFYWLPSLSTQRLPLRERMSVLHVNPGWWCFDGTNIERKWATALSQKSGQRLRETAAFSRSMPFPQQWRFVIEGKSGLRLLRPWKQGLNATYAS